VSLESHISRHRNSSKLSFSTAFHFSKESTKEMEGLFVFGSAAFRSLNSQVRKIKEAKTRLRRKEVHLVERMGSLYGISFRRELEATEQLTKFSSWNGDEKAVAGLSYAARESSSLDLLIKKKEFDISD